MVACLVCSLSHTYHPVNIWKGESGHLTSIQSEVLDFFFFFNFLLTWLHSGTFLTSHLSVLSSFSYPLLDLGTVIHICSFICHVFLPPVLDATVCRHGASAGGERDKEGAGVLGTESLAMNRTAEKECPVLLQPFHVVSATKDINSLFIESPQEPGGGPCGDPKETLPPLFS